MELFVASQDFLSTSNIHCVVSSSDALAGQVAVTSNVYQHCSCSYC